MERPLRQEEFHPGERRVGLDDRLDFACAGCGDCCTDTTAFLTPYDLWRLARYLHLTTDEFLKKTELFLDGPDGPPLLQMAHDPATGRCIWLDEDHRCPIYPVRPLSCRTFPLGVRHTPEGDLITKAHTLPRCRGEGGGSQTVRAYLEEVLAPEDGEWSRAYAALNRLLFPPGERRARDRAYLAYCLLFLFDLDRLPGEHFAAKFAAAEARLRRAAEIF
ncbi:MAG: YkgJ family cysteine cluster protein [Firmicutes bacterium]|nr:YkgJ family cysteine cluster protein [Bacillota bacterium]